MSLRLCGFGGPQGELVRYLRERVFCVSIATDLATRNWVLRVSKSRRENETMLTVHLTRE